MFELSQLRCFAGFLDHADARAAAIWDEVQGCASRQQIEQLRTMARRTRSPGPCACGPSFPGSGLAPPRPA